MHITLLTVYRFRTNVLYSQWRITKPHVMKVRVSSGAFIRGHSFANEEKVCQEIEVAAPMNDTNVRVLRSEMYLSVFRYLQFPGER